MKILFISILTLFLSTSVFSQSEKDYTTTLELIKKALNEKKSSLIHEKFDAKLKGKWSPDKFGKMVDSLHKDKGKMSTYELIMEDEKEKNFLVEFENGSMLVLLYLSKDGKITSFQIKDY
ncbi:hypothetical protein [uncultured Tenacibaculum sp.]|uniref:hypothetical protein n=1 Tax=uncultured Tenacibaculum sp. TaxID=174713 RepID=UPI00260AF703|nr:hypothetical protein [uncultured Tenacibaculum sp.]